MTAEATAWPASIPTCPATISKVKAFFHPAHVSFPSLPGDLVSHCKAQFSPVWPPRHQFISRPHISLIVHITGTTLRLRSVADADQRAGIPHPLQNFPPSARFPVCEISHRLRSHLEATALRPLPGPRTVSPSPASGALPRLSLLARSSTQACAVGILHRKQTVTSEDIFKFKEFNYSISFVVLSCLL